MLSFDKLFSDYNSNYTVNKSIYCWEDFPYTKHEIYLLYLVSLKL